jgi:hypothetical protein
MSVTSRDNGYAALVKRVVGMKPVTIAVGILEKDGAAPHEDSDRTLIEIATWLHFGVVAKDGLGWHIPPRPWVTDWFDRNEARLRSDFTVLMRSVVAGKRSRDDILNLMGQRCVGELQAEIAEGVDPPNAPSTIKQKGSSTPLIDHGQLRSAHNYQIKEGT